MDKPIVAALWRGRRTILTVGLTAMLLALFASVAYAANIEGTPEDDLLIGTENQDYIFGRGGDDLIRAGANRDIVFGGRGDDDLYGEERGDQLFGEAGNDYIVGAGGEDELYGFSGDDVLVTGDDKQPDEVRCGSGVDVAYVSGPDHSVLTNRHQCEEIITFKSFDEIENPGGTAGP
jgi:Ca2+-binding RTX toxin-like protein